MGLFSRNRTAKQPQLQVPDELERKARAEYGHQQFSAALSTYVEAIDKIHTMCVCASPPSRIRVPGPGDQAILDGYNSALGATLATDPGANVSSQVEQSVGYLRQIAGEAGPEAGRYLRAIDEIETTYRLGRRT